VESSWLLIEFVRLVVLTTRRKSFLRLNNSKIKASRLTLGSLTYYINLTTIEVLQPVNGVACI
jgi:hypothetical protein